MLTGLNIWDQQMPLTVQTNVFSTSMFTSLVPCVILNDQPSCQCLRLTSTTINIGGASGAEISTSGQKPDIRLPMYMYGRFTVIIN